MKIHSSKPLAPFTTFHIGGPALVLIEAHTEEGVRTALTLVRESGFPLHVLGAGSNVLVPDSGITGIVLRMAMTGISLQDSGDDVVLVADAGMRWEEVVDAAAEQGAFGIENLAGIPGTAGGAAVQNIGAYGAELSDVFEYADAIDRLTGGARRVTLSEAAFAYRTSFFKEHRELIITRVALRLKRRSQPNIAYADLARAHAAGVPLATPAEIARAVRAIRADKFPSGPDEGTAGSFFKNPVLSRELATALGERYPGLPVFPREDGSAKVSLAWLLDHALALKGYEKNGVRLYEKQPLVIVARAGATAADVNAFADEVSALVSDAIGIAIEREVETFGA